MAQKKLYKMTHRVLGGEAVGDTTTKSVTLCLLVLNTEHQQRQADAQVELCETRENQGFIKLK